MRFEKIAITLCALFSWGIALPLQAAVSCSVSASTVGFGTYNVLSATPDDATGVVTATCTRLSPPNQTVPYVLALSTGLSGNFNPRKMFNGAEALNYNLFRNNARTQIWGDGTGGTFTVSDTIPTLSPGNPTRSRNNTIFGRITIGQDLAAGNYLDSITVTMTF
jgi:spore coat protein U-like protein